ncbi:MAG TPA: hypothetical protein EYP62_02090 [Kiritimatiellae bacterium]|nr:hypothetical protein [Kiritimatiellia bacterium]
MQVKKVSEIEIAFRDEPGTYQRVVRILAEANIDGIAFTAWVREEQGHISLITEDNQRARAVLEKAGFTVTERPAVVVIDVNRIGSAAEISRRIAASGINLTEAYATAVGDEYMTVLRSEDIEELYRALCAPPE